MIDRFAHHLRLDQIRDGERMELNWLFGELVSVAIRFGIASIERLEWYV